jgi:hypothetical protein
MLVALLLLGCPHKSPVLPAVPAPAPQDPAPAVLPTSLQAAGDPAPAPAPPATDPESAPEAAPDPLTWPWPDSELDLPWDDLLRGFALSCRYSPEPRVPDGEFYDALPCDRPFEQMCAPDGYGCWWAGEECRDGCAAPCDSCVDECGGECDGCMASCDEGDEQCVFECADSRRACGEACDWDNATCVEACDEQEQVCFREGEDALARECPDCSALGSCLAEVEDPADCQRRFPGNASDCVERCAPEEQ